MEIALEKNKFNHVSKDIMGLAFENAQNDSLALDLRLSLFISAAQSFKFESLLKPFPTSFRRQDGEIDIQKLRELVSKLPETLETDKLDGELAELLKVACLNNNHQLQSITINDLQKNLAGCIKLSYHPHWVFQVNYNPARKNIWERTKKDSSTFFAFHGSRFENFHAILNLGLHQHLNKVLN